MNFTKLEKGSVILMWGDSTTDCGRGRPYGTYLTGLGDSYVRRMHEMVTATYPDRQIKFVNAGISGKRPGRYAPVLFRIWKTSNPITPRC